MDFEATITPPMLSTDARTPEGVFYKRRRGMGFSDVQLGALLGNDELAIRKLRKELGVVPTYKLVDTCAAEFEAYTPYYYSTYEDEDEGEPSNSARKSIILGGGPNRIGQGIEFDYCCCQASFALAGDGARVDHGQFQSRNREHRLRHLRQALFRAA